jgi:hypothetical protein
MTILKWLLVLVVVLYVSGVAAVYLSQRKMLFPTMRRFIGASNG